MEFNNTLWFVFGILLILIFAIVSNTSQQSLTNIQFQFDKMTCPFPIFEGVDHLIINGTLAFGMNITHDGIDVQNDRGTAYRCEFDTTTDPDSTVFYTQLYTFGEVCFSVVPCGWFSFASETLTKVGEKITAFFTLILFILTPINFNILGFGLFDIGGVGLAIIIGIYIFAYLGIGLYLSGYILGIIERFT